MKVYCVFHTDGEGDYLLSIHRTYWGAWRHLIQRLHMPWPRHMRTWPARKISSALWQRPGIGLYKLTAWDVKP